MACGTLAGLALLGTGAGLQYSAADQEKNAENNTIANALAGQNAFSGQAQGVFNNSLGLSTPQASQQQIQQGAQQAMGLMQQAQLPGSDSFLPSTGAGNAGNQASASGQQVLNQNSNIANANQQGYSNYSLQQYLKDLQAKNQLGVINSNASNLAGILPTELQAAATSQQGRANAGSLLGSLGGILSSASIGGASVLPSLGQVSTPATNNMLNGIALNNAINQAGSFPGTNYNTLGLLWPLGQ